MGRFASTVEFYARYREPYSPEFFPTVARQLKLAGQESLLDVGCGPGLLAIGFAPFVRAVTAIDPEPGMLAAAKNTADEAGANIEFRPARLEDLATAQQYDMVTIGRALHWLDRDASLQALERLVPASGRILICGAFVADTPLSPWHKPYEKTRGSWAESREEKRYRIDDKAWFAGSDFHLAGEVSVSVQRDATVAELVGRALSKSNTSAAVIGDRREEFEQQLRSVLQPFASEGMLREEIVSRATVFVRLGASSG